MNSEINKISLRHVGLKKNERRQKTNHWIQRDSPGINLFQLNVYSELAGSETTAVPQIQCCSSFLEKLF